MNNIEKIFKRLFFITISTIVLILTILGIAVYHIDPYQ